jgi:hypothetical protein
MTQEQQVKELQSKGGKKGGKIIKYAVGRTAESSFRMEAGQISSGLSPEETNGHNSDAKR